VERRAGGYDAVLAEVVRLVQEARSLAARSVNQVMTAAYWEIGRRIVEHEQGGAERAQYGEALNSLGSPSTSRSDSGVASRWIA